MECVCCFSTNFIEKLNDYETAVIYANPDFASKPFKLMDSKPTAENTAKYYYEEIYTGKTADNVLDAFRHTFWNSILTYEFNSTMAKELQTPMSMAL